MSNNGNGRGAFNPIDAGYIPVNQRIETFKEKYPNGSLQSEIVELGENIVILKAYAYREPDDPRPGVGHSQMPIPGKSNFTRDSEVENAETSAWGRALAAIGIEVKAAIATQEEVRNKQEDPTPSPSPAQPAASPTFLSEAATPAQKRKLMAQGNKVLGSDDEVRKFVFRVVGKNKTADLTKDDMQEIFKQLDEIERVNAALDGITVTIEDDEE